MVDEANKPRNRHPENCQACAEEHFLGVDKKTPMEKFRDPMCPIANPWCLYYEAALKLIGRDASTATTAAMLSRIRSGMKQKQEKADAR